MREFREKRMGQVRNDMFYSINTDRQTNISDHGFEVTIRPEVDEWLDAIGRCNGAQDPWLDMSVDMIFRCLEPNMIEKRHRKRRLNSKEMRDELGRIRGLLSAIQSGNHVSRSARTLPAMPSISGVDWMQWHLMELTTGDRDTQSRIGQS